VARWFRWAYPSGSFVCRGLISPALLRFHFPLVATRSTGYPACSFPASGSRRRISRFRPRGSVPLRFGMQRRLPFLNRGRVVSPMGQSPRPAFTASCACPSTKAPSLHRNYPASSGTMGLSDFPHGPACSSRSAGSGSHVLACPVGCHQACFHPYYSLQIPQQTEFMPFITDLPSVLTAE